MVMAKDCPEVRYGVSPARYDETIFCVDKARYIGDEIAAVAAVDIDTAKKAVELIEVEYEILPAVFTAEEAVAEGAPWLHDEFPGNLCAEVHQEFGDYEAALKDCDLIHKHTFVNKRQDAAFLEPNCAVADYDRRGCLTLTSFNPVGPLHPADRGHGPGPAHRQGEGPQALCRAAVSAPRWPPRPWT